MSKKALKEKKDEDITATPANTNNDNNNNNKKVGDTVVEQDYVLVASKAAVEREIQGEVEGEDDEGDEGEEEDPIPVGDCLFCSLSFGDVPPVVTHMHKEHGFFIPFGENLRDLSGLLEYLGAKVGMGHVCLYCNGRGRAAFGSTEAVQKHMNAKQHCKLRMETEEEEDELLEFYDFDNTSEKQAKPHVVDLLDSGELVLSDGSIIGHRVLWRTYRQNVRPADVRDSVNSQRLLTNNNTTTTSSNSNLKSSLIQHPSSNRYGGWGVQLYRERSLKQRSDRAPSDVRKLNKMHMKTGIQSNLARNLRYAPPSLF